MKRLCVVLILAMAVCLLGGCNIIKIDGQGDSSAEPTPHNAIATTDPSADPDRMPVATILFSSGDKIEITLLPQIAPNTVCNFIYLANGGFYDGSKVDGVVGSCIVKFGETAGDTGYTIPGEFSANGYQPNDYVFSHRRGVVSMTRQTSAENDKAYYNSASSGFFILSDSVPELDSFYAAFGIIFDEESLAVLDRLAAEEVNADYTLKKNVFIESVRVETFGVTFADPVVRK